MNERLVAELRISRESNATFRQANDRLRMEMQSFGTAEAAEAVRTRQRLQQELDRTRIERAILAFELEHLLADRVGEERNRGTQTVNDSDSDNADSINGSTH